MYITLPTIEKKLIEKTGENGESVAEIKVIKKDKKFNLDTSFYADLRFEEQFKKDLPDSSFQEFVVRMHKYANKDGIAANYLSMLKILYCCLDSEDVPTFKEFLQMFDYSIAHEILEKLHIVFGQLGRSAAKN